jgi:hypothetical protein
VSWAAVRRAGYQFALARMSIGRTTRDGSGRRNLAGMAGHIAVRGAYEVVGTSEPVEAGARLLVNEVAAVADPARVLVMFEAGDHPRAGQLGRRLQGLKDELDQIQALQQQTNAKLDRIIDLLEAQAPPLP